MKQIMIIMAFAFLAGQVGAQTITEDFESNSLGWNEYSSPRQTAIIKEGVMRLENKSNDKKAVVSCFTPIDVKEAFEVKVTFKNTKIVSDEKGVGIVFDYLDDYNCDYFMFSNDKLLFGKLKEGREVGYRMSELKINKKLKDHVVQLKCANNKIEFYIDDVQCMELRGLELNYNGFGLMAFGNGQVAEVDEIKFIQ